MKTVLRPVVRKVRRLYGGPGRPSSSREAVFDRWRTLASALLSGRHFAEAGLDDIWQRNPPKLDRQIIVIQALRNVVRARLEGDVCELGCFRGHTAIQIVQAMRALGDASRLWLFDSFEGMPPSDRPGDEHWSPGAMTADYDEVRKRFERFENVKVVRGFFNETLPRHDLAVKLAHVDCDMDCSVRDVNAWLLDRVVPGGTIVYDDYGFESCHGLMSAVDEDFAGREDYATYSLPTGQYLATRTRA